MRNRLSAKLDKLEQRFAPKRPHIGRMIIRGKDPEPDEVLDQMVAAGEITDDQRDDVFFIIMNIVDPPNWDEQSPGLKKARPTSQT